MCICLCVLYVFDKWSYLFLASFIKHRRLSVIHILEIFFYNLTFVLPNLENLDMISQFTPHKIKAKTKNNQNNFPIFKRKSYTTA